MIRILQAVGLMNAGGIQTYLMNIYRVIDRSQIQFDFVVHGTRCGFYDAEIERLGGRILRVPPFRMFNYFAYKAAWKKLLRENGECRILHTHVRSTAPLYLKIAQGMGFTTIAHAHSTSNGKSLFAPLKDFLQRNIAKYADTRLACSQEAGQWLFRGAAFLVTNNAIDTDRYRYDAGVRAAYRKEFYMEGKKVIGNIGRLTTQKNHAFLLDVFGEIHKRDNSFRLVLVGEGELRTEIESKSRALGLESVVIFTGVRPDIPQLLQMFDLFLFPSLWEGLPVALIEAQSAGLVCYASDVISQESIVTSLVRPLSLREPAAIWAERIIAEIPYQRNDCSREVKDAGFDIHAVAEELTVIYHGAR